MFVRIGNQVINTDHIAHVNLQNPTGGVTLALTTGLIAASDREGHRAEAVSARPSAEIHFYGEDAKTFRAIVDNLTHPINKSAYPSAP